MNTHLAVIGAGPGGFETALLAARRGLDTLLIHDGPLGGACLNVGCIPTKFWLGATEALEELDSQEAVKALSGAIEPDFSALQSRKDKLLEATRKAMAKQLAEVGARRVEGRAMLDGPGKLVVTTADGQETVEYERLVLATGSAPVFPQGLNPDGDRVLSSDHLLGLTAMPESLIVLGAGFIGLELALAASRFGARVTLLDALDRIAAAEDPEVSKLLLSLLKRRKWDIRLGVRATGIRSENGRAVLTIENGNGGEDVSADMALVAVGRRPATAGLGLESIGAVLEQTGALRVDERLLAAQNVFAIGDLNGKAMLAHAASHQARYVADLLTGRKEGPYTPGPVPSIVYGSPEIVRVGRMESEVDGCEVSRAQLAANPMAQAHAATRGFVKVVWENAKVVGVTAIGDQVSRLASAATIMVSQGWTRADAENLIFAHPTLDESLKDALLAGPQL